MTRDTEWILLTNALSQQQLSRQIISCSVNETEFVCVILAHCHKLASHFVLHVHASVLYAVRGATMA